MPVADMDFSINYCTVCDVAHEKGGLYCSLKCQKRDAKAATRSPTKTTIDTMSAMMDRSRSSLSLYAQSNPSSTSLNSLPTMTRSDSMEATRESAKSTRLAPERRLSTQRPLPPVKKNSYSNSIPKSLELVTPIMTPLTKQVEKPEKTNVEFMYPLQPAGTRFNHIGGEFSGTSNEPRRMFYFKKVQSEESVARASDEEVAGTYEHISRSMR